MRLQRNGRCKPTGSDDTGRSCFWFGFRLGFGFSFAMANTMASRIYATHLRHAPTPRIYTMHKDNAHSKRLQLRAHRRIDLIAPHVKDDAGRHAVRGLVIGWAEQAMYCAHAAQIAPDAGARALHARGRVSATVCVRSRSLPRLPVRRPA